VESQLAASGVPIAFVHAEGKKRWGIRFVGDSKDKLFADAAKLAGERVGRQLLVALAATRQA
jgi:hypothetical protein